jgi:thiamine biosynthesis lipoprotein
MRVQGAIPHVSRRIAAVMVAVLATVARAETRAAAPAAPVIEAATIGRARHLMGARLHIEARGGEAGPAVERAFVEVARLESVLSNWRADSEVSRVNAKAGSGPVIVSADLFAAVEAALRCAEATEGAFDPTVEPLVRAYGLRGAEGILPGAGAPPATGADAPVGWRDVRIDAERRTVAFAAAGMGLDFGGIGKGIALDAAARLLRSAGVDAALLDFAGQVLVFGAGPDAGGWNVGIADPGDRAAAAVVVRLMSGSLATSGNSERAVERDGRRTGHILDPRTGLPVEWAGSVSVRAGDATTADALTKAMFVLGPERGAAWAAIHGVEVLFLDRDPRGRLLRHGAGALFTGDARRAPDIGLGAHNGLLSGLRPPAQEGSE